MKIKQNKVYYSHHEVFVEKHKEDYLDNFTMATVAFRLVGDNTVEYSVAYCAPGDRFCKAKGREVSGNKLLKDGKSNFVKGELKKDMRAYELSRKLLKLSSCFDISPSWFKE